MFFYMPPPGLAPAELELPSGLLSHTAFNTLFHWAPLPFRSRSESLTFLFGGQVPPTVQGPLAHEFTHFWFTQSPLYCALDRIKFQAILEHYNLTDGQVGEARGGPPVIRNFWRWRYAGYVERLLAPIMEGTACLAEFDAIVPGDGPDAHLTPTDLLTRDTLHFQFRTEQAMARGARRSLETLAELPPETRAKSERIARETLQHLGDVEDFDHYSRLALLHSQQTDGGRAERKLDLYTLHPLLLRKGRGAHLLGYLTIRGLYLHGLHQLSAKPGLAECWTVPTCLHLLRQRVFFNPELVELLETATRAPFDDDAMILEQVRRFDDALHRIFHGTLEQLESGLATVLAALDEWGPGLGLAVHHERNGKSMLSFQSELEAQTYLRTNEVVMEFGRCASPGVATRVMAAWQRRDSLLLQQERAGFRQSPTAGLTLWSQLGDDLAWVTVGDPLPLPELRCPDRAEIDVYGYIRLDASGPKLLQAFRLEGRAYACSIGIDQRPVVLDEGDAELHVLNAEEAGHFRQLVDNVMAVGAALPEAARQIEAQADAIVDDWTARLYLDRVSPLTPLGQLYLVGGAEQNAWSSGRHAMLSEPNLLYRQWAKPWFSTAQWAAFVRASISISHGFSIEPYHHEFENWIKPWAQVNATVQRARQHAALLYHSADRCYSIF